MDTPPPQLTLSAINAHDTVVQLLPGLFLGGLAHMPRGQRGRWAAERATARTLKAAGRLAAISTARGRAEEEGERPQQQQHPLQLIMLETFLAGPSSSSSNESGGAAAAANAAEARSPFALSHAFLAQTTADEAADCRLLLHVRTAAACLSDCKYAHNGNDMAHLICRCQTNKTGWLHAPTANNGEATAAVGAARGGGRARNRGSKRRPALCRPV